MNSDSHARQAVSCISRPSKWAVARLGVRQLHALVAARGPAAHHGVGDVQVELEREGRAAVAERLHRKRIALGQQHRAVRQVEALAVPLIDVVGPVRQIARPAGGRPDRVIADLGVALGMLVDARAEMVRQHLRAEADAEERLALLERHRRSSRSRGGRISSSSLALFGPPKMTAPAWPSSVSGSGSPKRGRRMSSVKPRFLSAMADAAGGRMLLMQDDQDGGGAFMARTDHAAIEAIGVPALPIPFVRDCKSVAALVPRFRSS